MTKSKVVTTTTDPTRKTGRLANLWKVLTELDEALHFEPAQNLEKRVRAIEDQLDAQSLISVQSVAKPDRAA